MAKFERYDARDDARIFDGGELEDEDEEGSRLPLLLVIGLLVVAAFGGVVWLAYTQGVQRGRADAPRMLVAAGGPVKEAPANPGGTATPFTGLKIYQQPAPAEDEDSEAAPQPPTPKAATPAAPTPTKVVERPTAAAAPVVPAKMAVTKVAQASLPNTETVPPSVATKPPRSLHGAPAADTIPALKPASIPAPPPKPVQAETPKTTVAATETTSAHAGGGPALQIGAYKSEEEANAAWRAFTQKHPMAANYQSDVRKVDLADKGVWYRLRIVAFADKSEAVQLCDKLKADGGNCFLAK